MLDHRQCSKVPVHRSVNAQDRALDLRLAPPTRSSQNPMGLSICCALAGTGRRRATLRELASAPLWRLSEQRVRCRLDLPVAYNRRTMDLPVRVFCGRVPDTNGRARSGGSNQLPSRQVADGSVDNTCTFVGPHVLCGVAALKSAPGSESWQRSLVAAVTASGSRQRAEQVLQSVEGDAASVLGVMLVGSSVEWVERDVAKVSASRSAARRPDRCGWRGAQAPCRRRRTPRSAAPG